MILRVAIENLAIVEHAEFEPGPGLTAITGETGAGKTLLATAIALLFGREGSGAKATSRVGAARDHAWIEGEFQVDDAFWAHPSVAALAELRPDEDSDVLVLARRISREGRTRALAWGRAVSKSDLEAAGRLLLTTAGQHSQRLLTSERHQRSAVDAAGGDAHAALVGRVQASWQALSAARATAARLRAEAESVQARAEEVRDALDRIDAVDPTLDDKASLESARGLARAHAQRVDAVRGAIDALGGDDRGVVDALGRAWSSVAAVADVDEVLADVAASLLDVQAQVGTIASDLGAQLDGLNEGPGSIDEIEERLSAYDELQRHHGGTVESVLAARELLREQVSLLDDGAGAVAAADAQVARTLAEATEAAARLTTSRTKVAKRVGALVVDRLAQLGMGDSVFVIEVAAAELGESGADRVRLLLAPSKQLEPAPVADVASGGELSRIALALHVATGAVDAPTVLFDEIDAGIGGLTAHAIADMLAELAQSSQVLCITHLAQVAAVATSHVRIDKRDGHTSLTALDDAAVVDELVRMLGGTAGDDAVRTHAENLRGARFARTSRPGAMPGETAPSGTDAQLSLDRS